MLISRFMLLALLGWTWFYQSKPLYHDECPKVEITKRCVAVEQTDAK